MGNRRVRRAKSAGRIRLPKNIVEPMCGRSTVERWGCANLCGGRIRIAFAAQKPGKISEIADSGGCAIQRETCNWRLTRRVTRLAPPRRVSIVVAMRKNLALTVLWAVVSLTGSFDLDATPFDDTDDDAGVECAEL